METLTCFSGDGILQGWEASEQSTVLAVGQTVSTTEMAPSLQPGLLKTEHLTMGYPGAVCGLSCHFEWDVVGHRTSQG